MPISLRSVYESLDKLSKTPSTLEKQSLLKEYLKDPLFKQVIKLTYTQTYSYNIKAFPDFKQIGFCERGWEFVLPILKTLVQQKGADNVLKQKLFQAASIDKETFDVVRRICDGDLACGIAARSINKAVPNTVKILSYMRCATSKHIDKLGLNEGTKCIAQCKADGAFANMMVDEEGNIKFFTRSGQFLKGLDYLKSNIKKTKAPIKYGNHKGLDYDPENMYHSKVFHGELRIFEEDGTIMPRKKGNGLLKQCIDGTIDPKIAKRIFYTSWDCVSTDEFWDGFSPIVYQTRFFTVTSLAGRVDRKFFRCVEFEYVSSNEENTSFFRKMRAQNEEGIITKRLDGVWEDNQAGSFDCIKTKHSFECEVKITGWKYGKKGTKYENCIGSFEYASECGKLTGFCSGLTDEEREWDWDMMIGSVVTVEAESVISSKGRDTYSLYTPSFIEPREDRHEADNLERIIEISDESKKTRRRKA